MNTQTSKRELYEKKANAQLKEWRAEIDVMQAKLEKADAETRIKAQEHLEKLKSKRNSAKQKLEELKSSSDNAWSEMKDGFEGAWSSLSESFDAAKKQFRS